MKKLIALVTAAIATLAGYKKLIADQKAEIQRLHDQAEREEIEDAERDAKLVELEAAEQEANEAASALATQLNDEPVVQSVNPETFEVTSGPTQTPADLEFREVQAQNAGTVAEIPAVEASEPDAEEQEPDEVPLESMTVPQLTSLAADSGYDLGGATKKADIIAAITLAQEAEQNKKGGE